MITKPWMFLVIAVAGWLQRRQQDVIEYLLEENRILHQGLGNRLIEAPVPSSLPSGPLRCPDRLGGLLRFYSRVAA